MNDTLNITAAKIENLFYLKSNQDLSKDKINESIISILKEMYFDVKTTSAYMQKNRIIEILKQL